MLQELKVTSRIYVLSAIAFFGTIILTVSYFAGDGLMGRERGEQAQFTQLSRLVQEVNDKRFSRNNTISCASCHNVGANGADTGSHSTGWDGSATAVNTPTVFNSGFSFVQFWDGRAATLEEQTGTRAA